VPFTDHATAMFKVPFTAAENVSEVPVRMLAVGGETTTEIAEPGFGLFVEDEGPAPELHETNSRAASAGANTGRRAAWREIRATWNLASGARIVRSSVMGTERRNNCTAVQKKS
jgi:hypothetical protein